MPHIERTDQGEQYVIPGTERRTVPGLPYAAEADGQLTLHFYAPPEKAERRPRAIPLRPEPADAAPMHGGMTSTMTGGVPAQGNDDTVSSVATRSPEETGTHGLFGRRLAHFPQVFEQP